MKNELKDLLEQQGLYLEDHELKELNFKMAKLRLSEGFDYDMPESIEEAEKLLKKLKEKKFYTIDETKEFQEVVNDIDKLEKFINNIK